jgi:hypothetical protein
VLGLAGRMKDWAAELSSAKRQAPLPPPSRHGGDASYWQPPEVEVGLGWDGGRGIARGASAAGRVAIQAGRGSGSGLEGGNSMSTSATTSQVQSRGSLLTTAQSPGQSPSRERMLGHLEKLQQLRAEARDLFGA